MDDVLDKLMGVDKKNEIFNLWYEVTFLRFVFNKVLELNPNLHENLTQECLDKAREDSQVLVRKRFPNCDIKFN